METPKLTALQVMLPPFGITRQVHDREDENLIRSDLVEQAVRKALGPAASRSGGERRPSQRMGHDVSERGFDFVQELGAQAMLSRLVNLDRFLGSWSPLK